eukprot:389257-Prymnesium_polylepis.1
MSYPRSRTHGEVVCGVPTTFVLTAYSNRIMVVVTQQPNMGTLVRPPLDGARATQKEEAQPRCLTERERSELGAAAGRNPTRA